MLSIFNFPRLLIYYFLLLIVTPFLEITLKLNNLFLVLFHSSIQLVFVLVYTILNFKKPQFRSNIFTISSLILVSYTGISVLTLYFQIEVAYSSWKHFLIEEGLDNIFLLKAITYLNLFSFFFLFLGENTSKLFSEFYINIFYRINKYKLILHCITLTLILSQIFFFLNGSISLGGISNNEIENGINPVLSILFPLYFIIPFIGGVYIKSKRLKIIWIVILLFEATWLLVMNKRSMLLGIYLFSIFFWSARLSLINIRFISSFFILITVFIIGSSSFQKLRYLDADVIFNNMELSLIPVLYDEIQNFDNEILKEKHELYLVQRMTGSVMPLARFLYLLDKQDIYLLYGEDLLNNLKSSTPSDFFFEKKNIKVNEELYSARYPSMFDYNDTGNTIILQGLVDFGFFGSFIYMFLFFLIITVSYNIFIQNCSFFFVHIVYFTQLTLIVVNSFEETFIDIFSFIRFTIFTLVTTILINFFYDLLSKKK